MADFKLLTAGRFLPGHVRVRWVESSRRIVPDVESQIETAWRDAIAKPGVRLFDGPVARLESYTRDGSSLEIALSPIHYRIVVGTNFANPHLQDAFGVEVMANPLGVSTGLLTADGFWVMGRRNRSVAYYPQRVHPFAGSLEVRDHVDLFDDIRRELREELGISAEQINQVACVGLACDQTLRHPESIFFTQTGLTRAQVAGQLDRDEHDAVWSIPAEPQATVAALADTDLTPIARAALLLSGAELFGQSWFDSASAIIRDK